MQNLVIVAAEQKVKKKESSPEVDLKLISGNGGSKLLTKVKTFDFDRKVTWLQFDRFGSKKEGSLAN